MVTTAVGYIRMSTDDQEASPEQQREAVAQFATDNGYKIIRWYQDLGISGDKTEKRIDFQKMIAAGSTGEFDAILCWDQDRFGRFDMLEAGRWIHPLRQAGVHLATVTDGPIDWTQMAGRLVYSVKQEGKHQFLRDLSKNVSRGMDKLAAEGRWVTGVPPIGYVVDEDRRLQLGPHEDVAIVKDIFRKYLAGDSTRQISQWLSDRGILSPKGKKWTATGISNVLKNERYLGYLVYNQRTSSKYKDASNPQGRMKTKPREEWTIVPNTHPALVTQEDFDAVQELFRTNTRKTAPNSGRKYALSGLLRCGCCGFTMMGDKSNGVPSYTCYSYRERPNSCERYNVREDQGLKAILRELRTQWFDKYFTESHIEQIKSAMRDMLSGERADLGIVKGHLAKVEGQIEQAKRRLVEVPADMVRHVSERLRELEDQRDSLLVQLQQSNTPVEEQVLAVEERINSAIEWLNSLEQIAETKYDSDKVNRMLRQFIDRVELHFKRKPIGKLKKYHRCELVGGVVYFRLNGLQSVFSKSMKLQTGDRRFWTCTFRFAVACNCNADAGRFGSHTDKDSPLRST